MNPAPIITSLLDLDFYKLTMGQFVYHRYADVPVKYAFNNRTRSVHLADFVSEDDLRHQLDLCRNLRFGVIETKYLERLKNDEGARLFADDYLNFLRDVQLPPYDLKTVDGQFQLEFPGPWATAIYWETIALSVINELYFRKLSLGQEEAAEKEGLLRFMEKVDILRAHPHIKFSDFGTRRRFSKDWQDYIVGMANSYLPNQFLGTSNVFLAKKHNCRPIGTMAHELFMIISRLNGDTDDDIRASHNRVLREWWDEYGHSLSIALTDTFGSEFFFRDMTPEQAQAWKGLRQDSGDPIVFGENAFDFYERQDIDQRRKLIVFSDGLDIGKIVNLAEYFLGRFTTPFGWGTGLTNDLGFETASLVIKAAEANGRGTVKLSDNLAKAMGKPEDVERFKRIFGYTGSDFEECRS
jgi:nicotinate phosphoribosyltransferase